MLFGGLGFGLGQFQLLIQFPNLLLQRFQALLKRFLHLLLFQTKPFLLFGLTAFVLDPQPLFQHGPVLFLLFQPTFLVLLLLLLLFQLLLLLLLLLLLHPQTFLLLLLLLLKLFFQHSLLGCV